MKRSMCSIFSYSALVALLALSVSAGCTSSEPFEPEAVSDKMQTTNTGNSSTSQTSNPDTNNNTTTTPTNNTQTDIKEECDGCINSRDACVSGRSDSACGSGGGDCEVCDPSKNEACDETKCVVAEVKCSSDNCNGCCKDDKCVETTSDSACGSKGSECQDCDSTGGTCSTEGVCQQPCGPETCAGCCDSSGMCVSGDTKGVCGGNGESCEACEEAQECEVTSASGSAVAAGQCVNKECSTTCAGCCDANGMCQDGDMDPACGKDGALCQDCGSSSACVTDSGTCMPRAQAKWDLVLLQGNFPERTANDERWDSRFGGGKPDPFVIASYKNAAGNRVSKESKDKGGTLTPVWNETLFTGLTADQIRSDLKFDYADKDALGNAPDFLGKGCTPMDVNALFNEKPYFIVCGEVKSASGLVTYPGGDFSIQLKKS